MGEMDRFKGMSISLVGTSKGYHKDDPLEVPRFSVCIEWILYDDMI